MAAIQNDLLERIEAGELDQMVTRRALKKRRMELVDEAFEAIEKSSDSSTEFERIEREPEHGHGVVDEDASAIPFLLEIEDRWHRTPIGIRGE